MHWPGIPVYVEGKRTDRIATASVVNASLKELSPVWRGSAPGAEMVSRMEELIMKGVLARADIEELDGSTGQRMAAAIDWDRLRSDRRLFVNPEREDKAEENTEKGALGEALNLLNTEPPKPKTSDAPTPHETVQTGKTPTTTKTEDAGTTSDASSVQRWMIGAERLETLGIKSEADFERFVKEAEDGRAYREELMDLCHKTGVRAGGETYNRDVNDRMLKHLDTTDLRAELTSRTNLAKAIFRKDDPTQEDATRTKLTQEFGGRQTEPGSGPLGDRGAVADPSSKKEDKDDALYAVPRTGR